jgi:glyoxylase-like metal-dependent hydrolase (beta-lactamase superfamily II)
MNAIGTTDTDLRWDVLTIKRPGLSRDLPAGKEELAWVANSSTLIYGERDAVLVDTFLTTEQSQTLLDWVVASGKNLTAIYVTHGHGDHFFGLASLLERFPRAKAVATPEIVKAMQEHLSPAWIAAIKFAKKLTKHIRLAAAGVLLGRPFIPWKSESCPHSGHPSKPRAI